MGDLASDNVEDGKDGLLEGCCELSAGGVAQLQLGEVTQARHRGEEHEVQVTVVEAQRLQEGKALYDLLQHPLHVLSAGLQDQLPQIALICAGQPHVPQAHEHLSHVVILQGQQELVTGEKPGHCQGAHLHTVAHQNKE